MTALLFAVTNAFCQVPSYVPTNGLVGWWPFNGNANDESGNGNNGIVNGATLITDRNGVANKSYSFDGVDDYIEVSNNAQVTLTGNITMSAWVKTNGNNGQNYQTIISKRETYWTWEYNMILSYHNGIIHENKLITSRAIGIGNQEQAWSSTPYSILVWEFWTVVYSSGQVSLYKNGMLDQTQNFSLIPNQQSCPLLFGKNTLVDNSEQFFGVIDDIGIWNRALSASEIQQLYTTQAPCTLTNNFFATDTISACGNSVSLNAQNTGSNYLWSNNATTQSITANITGWYKCTVSQGANCSVSDSVYVSLPNALPTSLQAGLVGYWPFCGNANDESGNGNNGTVNGAMLTTDRFGISNKAYDFDGSNDYIDIVSTTGLNSNQGISMSLWFNWNGPNGVDNHQYLFLIANNPNGGITITDAGQLGVNVVNCNCVNDLNIETTITQNTWINIILSYDLIQGLMKMYLNGILINSTQENIFTYYTTNNPADRFGNYHFNSHYFNGQLDDAGLWNRTLTSSEVQQLYAAQSSNTTSNSNSGNSNSASSINNLPKGISYQAVARDSAGAPLSNANVEVRFTLRDSSITGPVVYKEFHTLTTNQFGLFTTSIGIGTAQTGDYNTINWMGPAKYLDVEIKQGANFLLMGSQQLLAVPYANAAISAGKIKNSQVPVFADNSAALAGGLQVGDMYRTPSGALMIVY